MELKVHGDTIESLIQERRDTEEEAKRLQLQIDLLREEKAGKEDPGTLEELEKQIEELTAEKRERSAKLKNICRMARTISAGD